MPKHDRTWVEDIVIVFGGEPDPGFSATGTKLGEQFSCLYLDRYMSID